MRPKTLIPPFPREDQQVVIHDRVWYIPKRTAAPISFIFPGWDHKDMFGNDLPVMIEYCSGNGAWITQKAAENPHLNWVAVEMKFDRVRKIWSKIKNSGLNNLLVVYGEAYLATQLFFPERTTEGVYINFPDPWPKKRHAKNRLVQSEFLDQLSRILKEGKTVSCVTDDVQYSEWLIKMVSCHPDFTSVYPEPFYITDPKNYGTSYFDQLWRSKGRAIRYHCFQKSKK